MMAWIKENIAILLSTVVGVATIILSMAANTSSRQQADAALEAHNPYLGIITHFDDGNKRYGIFVHNYAEGLAIIDSVEISGEINPRLNTGKWRNILQKNGFNNFEISCFSFSMPHKDMGLAGKEGVPLIFIASAIKEETEENKVFHDFCMDMALMKKLETIDIQISYKSRLPGSEKQYAKVWKLF
ncbi:MAG: hypothetical protein Q4G28_10705 [Neisseria sp.]|nr:hypothetical protein [Neisseria sp.]